MRWSSSPATLVIGHRGASGRALENTTEAFAAARADGADGVELDVQPCGTGEPVVFHDWTLERLGGRRDAVATTSLATLRTVVLAGGHRVATLNEAFEAIGPDLLVNVEIKARRVRFSWAFVADVVRRTRAAVGARGLVSSFHPGVLLVARAVDRSLPTGFLFHRDQSLPLRRAWPVRMIRPTALHPQAGLVTSNAVRRWHRRGYFVSSWTANDRAEVMRLARCGVDAVITDYPLQARAYL